MDARKSAIFTFQFVKPILQTIPYLIQYTILEDQFWFVKCTPLGYAKISSISIPSYQAMKAFTIGRLDENRQLHNAFKRI